MKKITTIIIAILYIFCFSAIVQAVTIDGNLSDWGVTPGSDWEPTIGKRIFFEDWTGTPSNGYLGPGYGGQDYDVEAMYFYSDGSRGYLALVTGFDIDNGRKWGSLYFYSGDIDIKVGNATTPQFGIDITPLSEGSQNVPLKNVSSWSNVDYTQHSTANPYRINNGTSITNIPVSYSENGIHNVLETGFPLSELGLIYGNTYNLTFHWTTECGNDYGIGTVKVTPTPEPSTLVTLGAGIFGALLLRRKSR